MPNGLAKSKSEHKVFVADQLSTCQDFSALQYRLSLERGCLVNWDTQAEVWARAFVCHRNELHTLYRRMWSKMGCACSSNSASRLFMVIMCFSIPVMPVLFPPAFDA